MFEAFTQERLSDILLPVDQWNPIPAASQSDQWQQCDDNVKANAISDAESLLGAEWPSLPATLYLQFARNGNRENFQVPYFERRSMLTQLLIAECMENNGRFLDDITNGIWAICEETSWNIPAHVGGQTYGVGLPDVTDPTVDLFAAQTAEGLAWTYAMLGPQLDTVSQLTAPRIAYEIKNRIIDPCFFRFDFWWMGTKGNRLNNWTPWICSNWLTCVLLLEQDPNRRAIAIRKILDCLDRFIDAYLPDGGCDEGPGYWGRAGASLFDCLDQLHSATNGKLNVFDDSLVQNIGTYIYKAHINDDWLLNFADAAAKGYPPGNLIFRYGRFIGDHNMKQHGAWLMQRRPNISPGHMGSIWRFANQLFDTDENGAFENTDAPMVRDVWLDGIEVVTSRDAAGSSDGLFLAAKGGHNAESHNHNDIGHFVIFKDGKPAIIDIGVETYTRKTFSVERYNIWTMQSSWHSLPAVNGVMQQNGIDFQATDVGYTENDEQVQLAMDIHNAYPEDAGMKKWRRTLTHTRGKEIILEDEWELNHSPDSIELFLVTPSKVEQSEDGLQLLSTAISETQESASLSIAFDADALSVDVEEQTVEDEKLADVWGDTLYRVKLSANALTEQGQWRLPFK